MSIFPKEVSKISLKGKFGHAAQADSGDKMTIDDLNPYIEDENVSFAACTTICRHNFTEEQTRDYKEHINSRYGYTMFLDDLPAAVKLEKSKTYNDHIPLGFKPKTVNNTLNDEEDLKWLNSGWIIEMI
jgi:hypothetical protein